MITHKGADRQKPGADPVVVATIEAEIERIQSIAKDELRALWQKTFKKPVPKALSRDLLARTLAWHIQERAFGGHDPAILKILAGYAKGQPDAPKARRLKPGTEIVREYQGERHTVVVTADGFQWREGVYPSLTAIARTITGTNWNGPRFFGLRMAGDGVGSAGARLGAGGREGPVRARKKAVDGHP